MVVLSSPVVFDLMALVQILVLYAPVVFDVNADQPISIIITRTIPESRIAKCRILRAGHIVPGREE